MNLLSRLLKNAEVVVRRIFQESSKSRSQSDIKADKKTHSGQVKNSGISSRTSPRMSFAADS